MEYTKEDIKVLPGLEHVKKRPDIYLPNGLFSLSTQIGSLIDAAFILGASQVNGKISEGWGVVASNFDWLGDDWQAAFCQVGAFPEAGVNSCRPEGILAAHASIIVLKKGKNIHVVVGEKPSSVPFFSDEAWKLQIGFRA